MSDATEQRPTTPFPADAAAAAPADPLLGDWSDGLRGAVRALGIPEPRSISADGQPEPGAPARAASEPPQPAPHAEEVDAPDAWGASDDALASEPPPPARAAFLPEVTPSSPSPAFLPDVTPSSPSPAFLPDVTPSSPAPAFVAEAAPFLPDVTPSSPAPSFEAPEFDPNRTAVTKAPDFEPEKPAPLSSDDAAALHAQDGVVELGADDAADAHHHEDVVELRAEDAAEAGVVELGASDGVVELGASEAADAHQHEGVVELGEADAAEAHAQPGEPPSALPAPAAEAPHPETTAWATAISAAGGDTPWSEPVAPAAAAPADQPWAAAPVSAPPAAEEHAAWDAATVVRSVQVNEADAWSAPPPAAAAPAAEWSAEAPAGDWQEVKKVEVPEAAEAAADWGALQSGPDWSAPAAAAPAADSGADAWGAAPPTAAASDWSAPAAGSGGGWGTATAEPETDWSAPAAPEPQKAAWNAPPVGASTLEQLDSEPEPMAPQPGAGKELFGAVGTSLSGGDDEPTEVSEELLRPAEIDENDPDLLVPVEEESQPPPRVQQPLAAMEPVSMGGLEVPGEHRVAVHTRGGRTRRGSVKDIDLAKSQFALVPQGGGAAEPVYHAEVKAIFFMLAPGEKLRPGSGGKVRITFADGRSIDGIRDGSEGKHGFFLVPNDAARTNTRRIYVAREAVSEVKDG